MSTRRELIAALERFGPLYQAALARRFCWRMGIEPRGLETDVALVAAAERTMRAGASAPDAFFVQHRGGRNAQGELHETPVLQSARHPYSVNVAAYIMETSVVTAVSYNGNKLCKCH